MPRLDEAPPVAMIRFTDSMPDVSALQVGQVPGRFLDPDRKNVYMYKHTSLLAVQLFQATIKDLQYFIFEGM